MLAHRTLPPWAVRRATLATLYCLFALAETTAGQGAFIAVSVRDLDASAGWYSSAFGLAPIASETGPNGITVRLLSGDGLIVELLQVPEAVPLTRVVPNVKGREYVHGLVKAGVIVNDFDQFIERLRRRGVTIAYGPFPARNGQPANVVVTDPDGNLLQFLGAAKPEVDHRAIFERLKTLIGSWDVTEEGSAEVRETATYALTGNGSVLVEHLISSEGMGHMMTTYYLDNGRLVLTHFCGAGNQPRMRFSSVNDNGRRVSFDMFDITNLTDPAAYHSTHLDVVFMSDDRINLEYRGVLAGREVTQLFRLARKGKGGVDPVANRTLVSRKCRVSAGVHVTEWRSGRRDYRISIGAPRC